MSCGRVKKIQLPQCPGAVTFAAGLEPNESYMVYIKDKFGSIKGRTVTTDEAGSFTINLSAEPFSRGMFMPFSGIFLLSVTKDGNDVALESQFDEYSLSFANIIQSNTPVLVEPNTVPVEAETEVQVQHNLSHNPVVQIILPTGEVMASGFMIVHNSSNDFTVTFTNPTTGTIIYL